MVGYGYFDTCVSPGLSTTYTINYNNDSFLAYPRVYGVQIWVDKGSDMQLQVVIQNSKAQQKEVCFQNDVYGTGIMILLCQWSDGSFFTAGTLIYITFSSSDTYSACCSFTSQYAMMQQLSQKKEGYIVQSCPYNYGSYSSEYSSNVPSQIYYYLYRYDQIINSISAEFTVILYTYICVYLGYTSETDFNTCLVVERISDLDSLTKVPSYDYNSLVSGENNIINFNCSYRIELDDLYLDNYYEQKVKFSLPSSSLFMNDHPSLYYLISVNLPLTYCNSIWYDEGTSKLVLHFSYDVIQTYQFWLCILIGIVSIVILLCSYPCVRANCWILRQCAAGHYRRYKFRANVRRCMAKKRQFHALRYQVLLSACKERGVVDILVGYLDDLENVPGLRHLRDDATIARYYVFDTATIQEANSRQPLLLKYN
ncbi:hypothetical protein RFI_09836 [Reticulomyxa filosa]|uniref:Uncharacterized protein n=1 Tax=Reticulomyxa filosa TaxID=46433 RepID=X6NMS2_RETFI|nr:hypothetical protein RFI_09836 [Reticulomyxa filosa]|eukprot:ETO27301.1 hypothetical protein RFI_09836 [Reticulomyxa filosa]